MDNRPYKLQRPKDLESYIIGIVADHTYLIFNRKHDICRCSRCGSYHKLSDLDTELGHNEKSFCPVCEREAVAKEERYGRKNITEYGRILWFRKNKSVTFAELDEYKIDYTGMYPKVSFWSSAQYKFSKKEQRYFKHVPEGFWLPERWEERKTIKLPYAVTGMWNAYKVLRYQKTVLHPSFISGRGTDLRYANLNTRRLGADHGNPYIMIGYITNFLKYQSIELLEKAGFERIVGEKANGGTSRAINWRGKDLRKILKMNNAEIRMFREEKPYLGQIELYQMLRRQGIEVKPGEIGIFDTYRYSNSEAIKTVKQYVDINKAVKYLSGQPVYRIDIYEDYLKECEKLGMDMSRKKVLFPENLQKAHEATSKQIKINKDRITAENFARQTKKIYPESVYQNGDYLIRAAGSPQELIEESAALSHCVRTYADSVADGRCAILFIRSIKEPDKPLFTLELTPDRHIKQCRGNHNCAYPEDIKIFLEHWKKEVLQKKKKPAVVAA